MGYSVEIFGTCDVCGDLASHWWQGTNARLCQKKSCDVEQAERYAEHCKQCEEDERLEREINEDNGY